MTEPIKRPVKANPNTRQVNFRMPMPQFIKLRDHAYTNGDTITDYINRVLLKALPK